MQFHGHGYRQYEGEVNQPDVQKQQPLKLLWASWIEGKSRSATTTIVRFQFQIKRYTIIPCILQLKFRHIIFLFVFPKRIIWWLILICHIRLKIKLDKYRAQILCKSTRVSHREKKKKRKGTPQSYEIKWKWYSMYNLGLRTNCLNRAQASESQPSKSMLPQVVLNKFSR